MNADARTQFKSLTVEAGVVQVNGTPLNLTAGEYVILAELIATQAKCEFGITPHLRVDYVLRNLFPARAHAAESNVAQVMLTRIRQKLRDAGAGVTVKARRSQGYTLVDDIITGNADLVPSTHATFGSGEQEA